MKKAELKKSHAFTLIVLFSLVCILIMLIFTTLWEFSPSSFQASIPALFKKTDVSILNFGDVMFDRGVRNIMENKGRDPFEYVRGDVLKFKQFDVVIANLEGPIVEMPRSKCQNKAYNFQFASTTPALLSSVGITMVNIANNHSYDCYGKGFESTKQYLTSAGIEYIGDKDLNKSFVQKKIGDKSVAFVGIDEATTPVPIARFSTLVKRLSSENDIVVVDIHWGTEYELGHTQIQESIAHTLIDNGATVIFGHHPHVIEPVEVYKGKAIFYSLGNFVFDQNFGDTTKGLGVSVVLKDGQASFTLWPYQLKLFAPEFMKGDEKTKFCDVYLKSFIHDGCSFALK
jgi:gamma-polyglutamate biosynthesis protein CapA